MENNELNLKDYNFSYITLKINGIGSKNILTEYREYFNSTYYPDIIKINGEQQYTINYSYYFNQTEKYVELIWNNS